MATETTSSALSPAPASSMVEDKTIRGVRFQIVETASGQFAVFVGGVKRATKPTRKGAQGIVNRIVLG